MESGKLPESVTSKSDGPKFFYVTDIHFITMSLITLGLFNTYWIYKNWKFIKERDDLDIMPVWRAIFGLFFIHSLLSEISDDKELNRIVPSNFSSLILATGWIVMNVFGNILSKSENLSFVSIGIVISISSFLFLLPVQNYIHNVNKKAKNNLPYSEWSLGQNLCLVIGVPLFILVLKEVFFR